MKHEKGSYLLSSVLEREFRFRRGAGVGKILPARILNWMVFANIARVDTRSSKIIASWKHGNRRRALIDSVEALVELI